MVPWPQFAFHQTGIGTYSSEIGVIQFVNYKKSGTFCVMAGIVKGLVTIHFTVVLSSLLEYLC